MRTAGVIVVIWLIVGSIAAWQRGYFGSNSETCAHFGTTAITIVAGPLNYVGLNPKLKCELPQPSK